MVSRHARLVRAVLLAVSLGGCLVVDDRLYACAEEGQCERGTACVEGLCVPLSRDGGAAPDAGEAADAGHDVDGGMPNGGAADGGEGDAGLFPDGGTDGGDPAADAGVQDAGAQDAGVEDAGVQDAGAGTPDGGVPADAGSGEDGGAAPDGGAEPDAGQPADAGTALDGGMPPSPPGDLCTQAVELQLDPQSGSATAQGTLAGSGSEHPLCGGSGPDLFYAVSARGSLTATAAALDGGAVDVAVLGSCPTGPVATCPSSGSSSNSTAARYLVAVTSVGSDAKISS